MNLLQRILKIFSAPNLPHYACAFASSHISMAQVLRHHGHRHIERSSFLPVSSELFRPSFSGINIPNVSALADAVFSLGKGIGLGREKLWAVTLPDEVTRPHIITLHSSITNEPDVIEDMLVLRIERLVGESIDKLRVSYTPLSPVAGQKRFLVSVAVEAVMREYERLFDELGWHVGLIWPTSLAEAVWLNRPNALPNQILLSSTPNEMTVLILHDQDPVLLRTQTFEETEFGDTLLRLLLFYRDRAGEIIPGVTMADNPLDSTVFEVLALGDQSHTKTIRDCIQEVFGASPVIVSSDTLGLPVANLMTDFAQIAAAAGLASLSLPA